MLESVSLSIIILIFIVAIHIGLLVIKNRHKKILEEKAKYVNSFKITPEKDKGEDFLEFGIYEPIVDYIKTSSTIDLIIVLVGIVLTVITIFYTDFISLFTC